MPGVALLRSRIRQPPVGRPALRVLDAAARLAPSGRAMRTVSPNGSPGARNPPFSTALILVSTRGPSAKPRDRRSGSPTSTARATMGTLPTSKVWPSFRCSRSSSACSTAAPWTPSWTLSAWLSGMLGDRVTAPARG